MIHGKLFSDRYICILKPCIDLFCWKTSEPRHEKTGLRGFLPGLTNRAVQLQKMARRLKFLIYEEEELYNPCSENKGADQLCSKCRADMRLCFCIGKNPVFS